ncbi:MAG TPA: ribosome-binding factor A [Candidatus Paceibacterota bacterium]|jgi:ribosome-binding factor A|nr:ribosome-binding factor A [Candidatus Paceibacterota bacterium]
MEIKKERMASVIKDLASKFLSLESNRTSLITVTDVKMNDKGDKGTIFMTVFPEAMEEGALDFTKRKRSDFREYVKEHSKLMRLPFFDFAIDTGEKNRMKIDELMNK